MDIQILYAKAQEIAKRSYSPYSRFRVGAALLCSDGTIYTGTNIENRSFGLTVCAERHAVAAAIADGKQEFIAVAIATPDAKTPVGPCGACRQVLSEFMRSDALVVYGIDSSSLFQSSMGELLPQDSLHDLI